MKETYTTHGIKCEIEWNDHQRKFVATIPARDGHDAAEAEDASLDALKVKLDKRTKARVGGKPVRVPCYFSHYNSINTAMATSVIETGWERGRVRVTYERTLARGAKKAEREVARAEDVFAKNAMNDKLVEQIRKLEAEIAERDKQRTELVTRLAPFDPKPFGIESDE